MNFDWLVTNPEKILHTPHCMGKSAQTIDYKDVATAPLCKRARILLEDKEIGRKGREQKVPSKLGVNESRNGPERESPRSAWRQKVTYYTIM